MANANVSMQIVPMVGEEDKIYEIVDVVIDYIHSTNVVYEVGAMETTMEGDLDELMEIVKEVQRICEREGAYRVFSFVKIDYKSSGITTNDRVYKYRE